MRGILLLLLVASSAINSIAQIGISAFPPERREAAEFEMKQSLLKNTSFRTNQFLDLGAVHAEFLKRFEETPGFGAYRGETWEWATPVGQLTLGGSTFGVFPPLLIGLENHQVGYLPRLGRPLKKRDFTIASIRDRIQTRPLTAFETNAVAQLKAGTNIVTAIEPARILAGGTPKPEQLLVLAPIHAKADCAKCHKCEEGKLLGAFSYAFTRIDAPTNTVKGLAIAAAPGR